MKIDKNDIREGKMNGQIVWICDYRDNGEPFQKPIRHIKPTKVLIRDNSEITSNKRIYYSSSHFCELNKDGSPSKTKVIALFDNTGYRSYTGVALNVFTTEEEAIEMYNLQKQAILDKMDERLISYQLQRDNLANQ